METVLDSEVERKAHLGRLDTILEELPDAEQAEVWRGIALNLAERYGEGKP